MNFRRRQAMGWGLGGVASLLLVRAVDQGVIRFSDSPALKAWDDWNQRRHSGPLALVAAGILAASPRNTQPWRFSVGRLGVDIFEVPERGLGAMDPFGRERLAGLGAAIHSMALASTGIGRLATVRLLPDRGNRFHAARIELDTESAGAPPPHPLLPAIGRRHTHRGPWTGRALGDAALEALFAMPRPPEIGLRLFGAESAEGKRFARLTDAATQAIAEDTAMMAASHRWFRHSRAEQSRYKDGMTPDTSGLSPLLVGTAAMLPAPSAECEGRAWLEATRAEQLPSASLFGIITAAAPWDQRQGLLAGMAWQRLHLIATSLGLVAQPLNQLPQIIDRARQTGIASSFAREAAALAGEAGSITFGFRLGLAEAPAAPSLRRPVSDVIGAPARLGFEIDRARAETAVREAQLEARYPGKR